MVRDLGERRHWEDGQQGNSEDRKIYYKAGTVCCEVSLAKFHGSLVISWGVRRRGDSCLWDG